MNLRSRALMHVLEHIDATFGDQPLNIIEIGTMYNENEGLSTFLIADFLAKRSSRSNFVSIDWDPAHIDSCRTIIQKRNPALNDLIDYRQGHSLAMLPGVLRDLGQIHFAFLDGGEHPEVCLDEFEQVAKYLSPGGAILLDDAQPIPVKSEYGLPRPLGKVNLILPMLLIRNYLQHRGEVREANSLADDPVTVPNAAFVTELGDLHLDRQAAFCVFGTWHRMLAYGSPAYVDSASQLSDVGLLRRTAHGLLEKLRLS